MKRGIILPDIHLPHEDKKVLELVRQFALANGPWDFLIQLGDLLDFDSMQPGARSKAELRNLSARKIEKDIRPVHKFFADWRPLADDFYWIEGNHDTRINYWLDANKDFVNPEDWDLGELAAKYDVQWVPYWSKGDVLSVGKANHIHGIYTTKHHASQHAAHFDGNVIYGHTHDTQAFQPTWLNKKDPCIAQSMGCLCKYQQSYMRGRPSKWQQAFGVETVFSDGNFDLDCVRIVNGRFVWGGQVWDKRVGGQVR